MLHRHFDSTAAEGSVKFKSNRVIKITKLTGFNFTRKYHYNDVIMNAMASQITSLTIVYSFVSSRRRSKKISKLLVTGLCEGNSSVTGELTSNAEKCLYARVLAYTERGPLFLMKHFHYIWATAYMIYMYNVCIHTHIISLACFCRHSLCVLIWEGSGWPYSFRMPLRHQKQQRCGTGTGTNITWYSAQPVGFCRRTVKR